MKQIVQVGRCLMTSRGVGGGVKQQREKCGDLGERKKKKH